MGSPENPGKATTPTGHEPFVDAVEAERFLGIRPRRVLELARGGGIPACPLGDAQIAAVPVDDEFAGLD